MNPVPVTCPTPAAIWGMDPAIAGAVVGALIAGLAAWGMAWWAEHRNTRQRQLEAVAEFLRSSYLAGDKWAREDRPHSMPLHGKDSYQVLFSCRKYLIEVLAVKVLFYGELRRELGVLELKVMDKEVRKKIAALNTFIQNEYDRFDGEQDHMLALKSHDLDKLRAGQGTTELEALIASPLTDEYRQLWWDLKETARERLT